MGGFCWSGQVLLGHDHLSDLFVISALKYIILVNDLISGTVLEYTFPLGGLSSTEDNTSFSN